MFQQSENVGRRPVPGVDALFGCEPDHRRRVESAHGPDVAGARGHGGDAGALQPRDVEHRKHGQPGARHSRGRGADLCPLGGTEEDDDLDEANQAPVAQDRGLGSPRGSRGELHQRRLVLVDGDVGQVGIGGEVDQGIEVVLHDHHGHARIGALEALEARTVGHQQRRAGPTQRVFDLVAGPPSVAGHDNGPQRHGGPERQRPLRAVGGQDGHPVTSADPALGQCRSHRGDPADVVGEGQGNAPVPVVEYRIVDVAVTGRRCQQVA